MAQMMFETFSVPKIGMGNQSVFSLYSTGHFTGVVIESGEGVSHSVPIYDGKLIDLNYCII